MTVDATVEFSVPISLSHVVMTLSGVVAINNRAHGELHSCLWCKHDKSSLCSSICTPCRLCAIYDCFVHTRA
jgi:hypothetical protein